MFLHCRFYHSGETPLHKSESRYFKYLSTCPDTFSAIYTFVRIKRYERMIIINLVFSDLTNIIIYVDTILITILSKFTIIIFRTAALEAPFNFILSLFSRETQLNLIETLCSRGRSPFCDRRDDDRCICDRS